MCTVTYLPTQEGGYILTSSRDERHHRGIAIPPRKYVLGHQSLFYPKDPDKGGTWFATQADGETLCLLNGAFQRHEPGHQYALSRGLMLLDFFNYHSPEKFATEYDFSPVEPFTLILLKQRKLSVLKWDGNRAHLEQRDPETPAVWSSVTLYSEEVIHLREEWFARWLQQHADYRQEEIMHFHRFGGEGDPSTDIRMSRDGVVQTVSISSVEWKPEAVRLQYDDLLNARQYNIHVI